MFYGESCESGAMDYGFSIRSGNTGSSIQISICKLESTALIDTACVDRPPACIHLQAVMSRMCGRRPLVSVGLTWVWFTDGARGFTKYSRVDYAKWKGENRLVHDGVNAKVRGYI